MTGKRLTYDKHCKL